MAMSGLPAALIAGHPYTVALEPTGAGELGDGRATISVFDRTGRGWSATYESARGLRQEFTVGLHGSPYRVSVTYPEPTCERTLETSLPVTRRVYAVVGCARRAIEPKTLLLRCGGRRLRVAGLRWTGWNRDTATGRGHGVTVTLSSPRECATLGGFIYTRARIVTPGRTLARVPIACPLP